MYHKLGILGGMGPMATYTLYKNIIESTPVEKDQEHIDMVILNASYIPDRTAGILNRGESPLVYLFNSVKLLEHIGCDLIAIPCNTSHYYYDELQEECKAKILNMPDLTAVALAKEGIKKVYLMATEGTIVTGIYQKFFNVRNIEIMPASDEEIAEMMRIIYDIKAGKAINASGLRRISEKYFKLGCEKIVLGCTELSIEKKIVAGDFPDYYIDAMQILQDEILELFGIKSKNN